ncbi:TetR/AcrR family transcriptional regulator [Streptodolium elevatio]|uniref:TetR family transcriptional regulator C-terminal domain-containing protein n=1 Tax=Streptodolium elevatio TaxID=3157996 RepID=A0ABV3DPX6_9ACTN
MTSRPGPQRIRKLPDERRAEILRTAARIALEEGLERITLRRVADELGVRPGLIGHYFPAADNLVSEAFADAATRERDALLPADEEDRPPTERLARFLARLDDPSSRDLSRLWLNARHLSRFREGLREVVDGQEAVTRGALTALVEDGVKSGEFTTDDALGAALHILVVVDGIGAYANGYTDVGHPAVDGMATATAERVLGLHPGALRGTATATATATD